MEDNAIVELYFARSEQAIRETEQKYGAYLNTIATNILHLPEDAEETVSDTYLAAWNADENTPGLPFAAAFHRHG